MRTGSPSPNISALRWALAAGGALAVSFALSFAHPLGNPGKLDAPSKAFLPGAQLPPQVRNILANKCIDCHSEQTRWPVYARLAPASWMLEHDVKEARSHWNLSRWDTYSWEEQAELLSRLGLRAKMSTMPPSRYTLLHPGSRLTPAESAALYDWTKAERRRLRALTHPNERIYDSTK